MKKLLVGLSALLVAAAPAFAADGGCGTKNCGCKPKKYRIIYVTAHNPDTMYGDYVFADPDVGPDYVATDYDEQYNDSDSDVSFESRRYSSHDWYIGGRIGLNLLSWKNKYSATPESAITDMGADHDSYWFEPVFGGDIFVGGHFNPAWRGDIEGGYATQFTDSDSGFTFKLQIPYVTANVYYDFLGGFYLGAGAGMAFPKVTLDWEHFVANDSRETKLSFTGALMAGYTNYLSERVAFDFRYRIAGMMGPTIRRGVTGFGTLESLETKTGFILDNSFTIGLRYEF
jgi:opacity protein-like surface antigen